MRLSRYGEGEPSRPDAARPKARRRQEVVRNRRASVVVLEVSLAFEEACLPRKEVIQPHVPVRLPCYDFTPLTEHTFGGALLAVRLPTSGVLNSGGVTGGVYKARERIHRAVLMRDY